jgi:cytochrome c553
MTGTSEASHISTRSRSAEAPFRRLASLNAVVALLTCLVTASAALLAAGLSATAYSRNAGADDGKAHYCSYCHGPSGRGYLGYQPIPRLAGQVPEYLVNQLRLFAEGRRGRRSSIAMASVHGVTKEKRQSLAAYYAHLNPPAVGRGPASLVSDGRAIYEDGVPEANLPACAACHGSGGSGNAIAPRLAGQLYSYTVRQLLNWNRDRRQSSTDLDDPAVKMDLVIKSMSRSQIDAVAAYLSYQH